MKKNETPAPAEIVWKDNRPQIRRTWQGFLAYLAIVGLITGIPVIFASDFSFLIGFLLVFTGEAMGALFFSYELYHTPKEVGLWMNRVYLRWNSKTISIPTASIDLDRTPGGENFSELYTKKPHRHRYNIHRTVLHDILRRIEPGPEKSKGR